METTMQQRAHAITRRFGRAVTLAVTAAFACAQSARPAYAQPDVVIGLLPVGDFLLLAIVSGVILAGTGTAILFHRAAIKARRGEIRAEEAMKALRQELDVAQSIVMAEPQVLIAF
jgi:hypothetical protein